MSSLPFLLCFEYEDIHMCFTSIRSMAGQKQGTSKAPKVDGIQHTFQRWQQQLGQDGQRNTVRTPSEC